MQNNIVDTHIHIWRYSPTDYDWINSEMSALKKDYLPMDLNKEDTKIRDFSKVLIQARQTPDETDFLLDVANKNTDVKGVIGWVDLQSDNLDDYLDSYEECYILKGFRHIIQDEVNDNFIIQPNFMNGVRKVLDRGYVYEILIYPKQIQSTIKFMEKFTKGKLVLDHCGKPRIGNGTVFDSEWANGIYELSKFPNLYCKLSGLLTEAKWNSWSFEHLFPYLDVVYKNFGPERIMWGSDWPVSKLSGSYLDTLTLVTEYPGLKGDNINLQKILCSNANLFYSLSSDE